MNNNNAFLNRIPDLPLLTPEREKELGATVQKFKGGKQKGEAVTELVEHNMKLVVKEAYAYSRKSAVSVEELFNAGRAGLVKAAFRYDPVTYDTRFSTYAIPWIKQGIRTMIHGDGPVKVPVHVINSLYHQNKAIEEHGEMSDEETKEHLGISDEQFECLNKARVSGISMNKTLSVPSGDAKTTLADILPDENAEIPGENGLDDIRYDYIEAAMSELDEQSRDVIQSQIADAEKTTLGDIGERWGITGERVRQIKEDALVKLKQKIVYKMSMDGREVDAKLVESLKSPGKKKRGRPKKVVNEES